MRKKANSKDVEFVPRYNKNNEYLHYYGNSDGTPFLADEDRDNAIYLFWESNGRASVDRRVLVAVTDRMHLISAKGRLIKSGDFTQQQIDRLCSLDFDEGNFQHGGFCWSVPNDNNDTSLFIARYPMELTFDMGGVE